MKKICSSKNSDYCFFVDIIDDQVIIVSNGSSNPFDNLELLTNSVETLAGKLNRSDIEVYVDLLSCVGDRINRFGKARFHSDTRTLDIFSFVNIATDAIPENVKNYLTKFYEKHINSVIKNSVLSQAEICKVKKYAI
jgi:predicted metal-dependent hydrolase